MSEPRSSGIDWGTGNTDDDHNEVRSKSTATTIVRLALDSGIDLWHTPTGECYVSIAVDGHHEHHSLAGHAVSDYLGRMFYVETGKAPSASARQDAIATLSGIARYDGERRDIYVRVASDRDCIYLDLGDPAWRAVEVAQDGWRIVSDPPVRFRRPGGMLPLPAPVRGGSIEELHRYINVASETDFCLVASWVIQALRPFGPYPILVLIAEQGAAKTTGAKVLRRLCDPNQADVRRPPRNTEDLMVAATNGHVVAFDNLSRLRGDLSDNLAVLATGGGFSVRQLYTNRGEVIFQAQRPIILNGISQVATRGDLLDRAIVATMPPIPAERRRDEATFWREFDAARPRILGALLDAVSCGLRRLPHVHLERKPRMADFALWSVAVEPACPWPEGTFLKAYAANRQGAVEAILDGDPVADVVHALAPWTGTATELLSELNKLTPDHIKKGKGWFSRPRQVSDALRRLAPGLRRVGFGVDFGRHGHTRTRVIEIVRLDTSASSAGSSADRANVFKGADAADAADAVEHAVLDDASDGSREAADGDLRSY